MNIRLGLTAEATGTGDAITATFNPSATLEDRKVLFVTAIAANTITNPTFAPDGLTAHVITKLGGQSLAVGDILGAGHVLILQYNLASTRWELLNPSKLLTHSTLAQILANDNKTGGLPIHSDNENAFLKVYNNEIALSMDDGATGGANFLGDYTRARMRFIEYGTFKTGEVNIDITRTYIKHSDLIELNAPSVTKNGSEIATQSYVDGMVAGLLDDRGSYDASGNVFPSSGGSGTLGAILKGDIWYISVAGTLGGQSVVAGDSVRALVDSPAQTSSNWSILETNIGYVPENVANKTDTVSGNEASSTKYLSVKGVYDYLIGMTWLTDSIFGTWLNGLTGKTTPVDADGLAIKDSADSNKAKFLSFTNLKAFLKTFFDTQYQSGLLFKQNTTITHTGTLTQTVLASFALPIGFNQANDFIKIWGMAGVDVSGGAVGNNQIRFYIGSNPTDIIGAQHIATMNNTTTLRTFPIGRTMVFKNSLTDFELSATTSDFVQTDYATNTNAPATYSIDFSTQKYFHITGTITNVGNIISIRSLYAQLMR